jgi:phage shock protein A
VRFREEIRALVREKSRMLATLANAQARRRIQEALEGLSVDAEMRALEGVREHIGRMATEGTLEREIGAEDEGLRQRLRAIRDDARHESARRELEELKRQYRPQALPESNAAEVAAPAPGAERVVPVAV